MTTITTDLTTQRQRRRKIAAVLAGGLVLGVGTMATLASWNDSEFAAGTFSAGQFALEGGTATGVFSEHGTAGAAAALSFTAPFNNLSPTDVVYAPYAVRVAPNTTNDATVTITAPSTTGTVTNLTYTVLQTAGWGCTSASTGTALVPTQSVGTATGAVAFDLVKGSPTTAAGTSVFLCFKVTAGSISQAQTGSATWQFQAVSKSS